MAAMTLYRTDRLIADSITELALKESMDVPQT